MNLESLKVILGGPNSTDRLSCLRCNQCKDYAQFFFGAESTNIWDHCLYSNCTACKKDWMVCLKCNLLITPRWKRKHFDPIFGCRTASKSTGGVTALAGTSDCDVINHDDLVTDCDTVTSVNEGKHPQQSGISSQEAWSKNAWAGDPSVFGTLLSIQSTTYFSKEMKETGLGKHYLVQKAFNKVVRPEDLSNKEVKFHLNLCSIFHGITRRNRTKLAGVLTDLVPALLERPTMPTIQPTLFLENIMRNLRESNSLSRSQLGIARAAIQEEVEETINRMEVIEDVFKHTAIPTTEPEILKRYLTGVHSIVENLPCPNSVMTPDGKHSYLPITEVMATYLAHGYNNFKRSPTRTLEEGITTNTYYQSPHYQKFRGTISDQVTSGGMHFLPLLIAIKDWSDDFDKNNSARNRHSIWMKTVTVLLDDGNGSISYNSFVIAIGSKGDSHEDVEKLYAKDLKRLMEPSEYYFGGIAKNVVAVVYLAASIQDRPERDSANGTLGHSSTFCKRFQYCCFIDKDSPISSCRSCYINRIARLQQGNRTVIRCDLCTDWSMGFHQVLLHKKISDFPTSFKWPHASEADGCPSAPTGRAAGKRNMVILKPIQMTYKWMIQVVRYCFFNYQTRLYLDSRAELKRRTDKSKLGWNKGETQSYLRVCGLSKGMAGRIIKLATECSDTKPEEAVHFVADIIPALWQRPLVQLHFHHDAIFHMIFHGILPDIVQLVSSTLKKIEIRGEVDVHLRWLVPLLRDYHLNDLPVLPFSMGKNADPLTMSSWVGSQKVAFSRVITYCFCQSSNIASSKFVSGVRCEEKGTKAQYFINLMNKMLQSYSALVARVMSRHKTSLLVQEVDEYIKLFLSSYLHLESAVEDEWNTDPPTATTESPPVERNSRETHCERESLNTSKQTNTEMGASSLGGTKRKRKSKNEKDRKYISTGNHLSMLNIPSTIEEFGTIRDFWDGNDEKLVQKLKPRCKSMRKEGLQTWKRTVLDHVTQSQSLDIITGYNDHEKSDDGLSKFVYKEKASIIANHAIGLPLMVARIRQHNEQVFCLYKKDIGKVGRMELQPMSNTQLDVGGSPYVAVSLLESRSWFPEVTFTEVIQVTGIVLPLRMESDTTCQKYWHIIDFDWNVYQEGWTWPGIWR
jgi:hypothetical protein